MSSRVTVVGTGGAEFRVDPDAEWVQAQLANGQLRRTDGGGKKPAAAEPEPEPGTDEWVDSLTVEELRHELGERDLSKSGNKAELVDRLRDSLGGGSE